MRRTYYARIACTTVEPGRDKSFLGQHNPEKGNTSLVEGHAAVFLWDTVWAMSDVPEGLSRLARAVTERRRTLGLTRVQVHENGGPADTTLARIENPSAETAPPRPTTLRRLDAGLAWPEGSAARTLHGASGDADQPLPATAQPDWVIASIEMPVAIVRDLVRAGDHVIAEHPGDSTRELKACIQQITATYATEVLERVGGPGASIPLPVELTFREHLSAPLAPQGDPVRSDQLYRRWLAGNALPEGDQHLTTTFEARWRAKRRAIMLRTSI